MSKEMDKKSENVKKMKRIKRKNNGENRWWD